MNMRLQRLSAPSHAHAPLSPRPHAAAVSNDGKEEKEGDEEHARLGGWWLEEAESELGDGQGAWRPVLIPRGEEGGEPIARTHGAGAGAEAGGSDGGLAVTIGYVTYNELTEETAEDVGSTADTSVSLPSACIIYHHATLMRVWEFLSGCVLAQTIEASIPYLGTEDVPSRLQVSMPRLRVVAPAASSAANPAPAVLLHVECADISKLQPVEGLRAGTGGMLMHLGGCSLGAAFEGDDLSEQSHAHAGAPPLVWGVGPGVAAEMLAVEWVLLRMEYPMIVGGGAAAGVPELSTRLSLPADPTLRATPRQLALLAAVQAYNLASMPLYVHPLPHLPPRDEVLRFELVTLPLLRVQLHAPQLGSSALLRRGSFASADHRQRFENNGVLVALPEEFERVCSIALRGLGLRWLWRNNLSAELSLSLEALCVHGESAALRHELEDGWGWEDEDDEEALAAAVPLEARGLGVPLLSSAPRATPEATALPSAPISPSETVLDVTRHGEKEKHEETAEGEEGEEGVEEGGGRAAHAANFLQDAAAPPGQSRGHAARSGPYLPVEPSAAQLSSSTSSLNPAAALARRHRRSTSDPQLNLNLIKDELELPPGSGVLLAASSPSAHHLPAHRRSNSVFTARDNQLAGRGGSGLVEMSAPSPRTPRVDYSFDEDERSASVVLRTPTSRREPTTPGRKGSNKSERVREISSSLKRLRQRGLSASLRGSLGSLHSSSLFSPERTPSFARAPSDNALDRTPSATTTGNAIFSEPRPALRPGRYAAAAPEPAPAPSPEPEPEPAPAPVPASTKLLELTIAWGVPEEVRTRQTREGPTLTPSSHPTLSPHPLNEHTHAYRLSSLQSPSWGSPPLTKVATRDQTFTRGLSVPSRHGLKIWDLLHDQVEASAAEAEAAELAGVEATELAAPLVVGGTLRMLDVVLMPCCQHVERKRRRGGLSLPPPFTAAQACATHPGGAPEPPGAQSELSQSPLTDHSEFTTRPSCLTKDLHVSPPRCYVPGLLRLATDAQAHTEQLAVEPPPPPPFDNGAVSGSFSVIQLSVWLPVDQIATEMAPREEATPTHSPTHAVNPLPHTVHCLLPLLPPHFNPHHTHTTPSTLPHIRLTCAPPCRRCKH